MDSFQFDFDTDSTLTNDTNSNSGDLDWSAFQSAQPPMSSSPFSATWLAQQDDAVAPDNRTNLINAGGQDDGIYFEIEHFFNGLNQQNSAAVPPPSVPVPLAEQNEEVIQPIDLNLAPTHNELTDFETTVGHCGKINENYELKTKTNFFFQHRIHQPSSVRTSNPLLPAPLVPRLSSSRSQCYHKLPDHAVKLMQEWYNANLEDPYPRSPDKKRFITEGNITAQQCRSWFANRRQRLKHVKRNHPRASSSNSFSSSSSSSTASSPLSLSSSLSSVSTPSSASPRLQQATPARPSPTLEETSKSHEHCYYCQQPAQPIASSPLPMTFTSAPTTTLNVVINQQTVEQLIHNSLRKLLYPAVM